MKKITLLVLSTGIFLVLITMHQAVAQKFIVTEANNSEYDNGLMIKVGDTLQVDTQINIANGGGLSIRHPNWYKTYFTKPGSYRMDYYLDKIIEQADYLEHDSLYNLFRSYGIDSCVFGTMAVKGLSRTDTDKKQDPNQIIMSSDSPTTTNQSTIRLEWSNPERYKDNYFIIINNMFDDYLDQVYVTRRSRITLDLSKYGKEKVILVKIYNENCQQVIHLVKRIYGSNSE